MQRQSRLIAGVAVCVLSLVAVGGYALYRNSVSVTAFEGKTLDEWSAQLKSGEAKERLAAARTFVNIRSAADPALPALVEALKDPDRDVRHEVAIAIGNLGPKAASAVPALAEALGDKDFVVLFRAAVAEALGNIGAEAKAAVPALVQLLEKDTHPFVQYRVGGALKKIDPEAAAKAGVK